MSKMLTGAKSEAIFTVTAFDKGWEVAKPYHHSQSYDFCIRRSSGHSWETVQVKTAYPLKTGGMQVALKRERSTGAVSYEKGDFDWLFVVSNEDLYLIPYAAVSHIKKNFRISGTAYEGYRL